MKKTHTSTSAPTYVRTPVSSTTTKRWMQLLLLMCVCMYPFKIYTCLLLVTAILFSKLFNKQEPA